MGCATDAEDAEIDEPADPVEAYATTACTGPFDIDHQQPRQCLVYPQSLWNKKLPANVMSQRRSDSASIVNALFTRDGTQPPPWQRNYGESSVRADTPATGGGLSNAPLYYGQATDPVYIVAAATKAKPGPGNPVGKKFRAPDGAAFSFSGGDAYLNVWDQTSNMLFTAYRSSSAWVKLPACRSSGHAGTVTDPCPANFTYAALTNWLTDKGFGTVGSDSLPNGGWATHIRAKEIMEGPINHAVFLLSDCMSGTVFPADTSSVTPCPSNVKHAPLGALFFLDYTSTQLADLKMKLPLWQYRILEALTLYGGYFGEATYNTYEFGKHASIPMVGRFEGSVAYEAKGIHYPLYDWFKGFQYDPNNSNKAKPLACYTYGKFTGCSFNPYVNVPLYSGPACPNSTCDVSKHMHIANECVARGLAGQPGGC